MFQSALFRRIYIPLLLIVLGYSAALYAISAPILRATALKVEARSARSSLDNLYALASTEYRNIGAYEESLQKARKRQLRNMLAMALGFLARYQAQAEQGAMSEEQARQSFLLHVNQARYDNENYFWVSDYQAKMLGHPDPDMRGRDFSGIEDAKGRIFLPDLIDRARKNPEGAFATYWFARLSGGPAGEKLAFARDFPEWGWVVGSGVYLEDVKKEVDRRREEEMAELRGVLAGLSMGRPGYAFIYDAKNDRVIHADPAAVSTEELSRVNPHTGKPLIEDLLAAAAAPGGSVTHAWDRPGDRGNYSYESISYVRHFEAADWYIVSTVFLDQMEKTAGLLRTRVLAAASLLYLALIVVTAFSLRGLLAPVNRLSRLARSIEGGDLKARVPVAGSGELAQLSHAMNSMASRLAENIERLDQKVRERTAELNEKNETLTREISARTEAQAELFATNEKLSRWVSELERRNREVEVLNRLGDLLQAAGSEQDALNVTADAARELFPGESGVLFFFNPEHTEMAPAATWGYMERGEGRLAPGDCWALRRGKMHVMDDPDRSRPCAHCRIEENTGYLCAPLVAQGEILGVVHLRFAFPGPELTGGQKRRLTESRRRLALALVEHLSLALANIRLRDRLRDLSVRDPLTGLFNRRYMEESLAREIKNAERAASFLGIIMMDVDHFKKFNDTHGHEAGDKILARLGAILSHGVRAGDIACRYGGEEFLLILPGADLDIAAQRAHKLILRAAADLFRQVEGVSIPVTVSAGVSAYPIHGPDPEELINAADAALYRAKDHGRNRVELAPPP